MKGLCKICKFVYNKHVVRTNEKYGISPSFPVRNDGDIFGLKYCTIPSFIVESVQYGKKDLI